MFTFSYLLDYSILITLLFTILPIIDFVCDIIGLIIIDLVRIIGKIIIYIIKMTIRFGLYYLMAILYVFWFALIINVMVNLFYESTNIFNTFVEEQNNLIRKIDTGIYKN